MTTFALVHGAWHSGACWDPTATVLRERGHQVITMDLPCSDPTAGVEEYVAVVVDALGEADDVVLVGHSLGGLAAWRAAERRPVRELVLLAAMTPAPGLAMAEDVAILPKMFPDGWAERSAHQVTDEDGLSRWPIDAAIDVFYHDCDPALAAWAASVLRPQAWAVAAVASPLRAYPDVPTHAIVCVDDRILRAETCARLAEERFGARVTRLDGGHSPMLAQPEVLADALTSGLT